jgi:hypothetical protein
MFEWTTLTLAFRGWTLSEIKDLSPRERANWMAIATRSGKPQA